MGMPPACGLRVRGWRIAEAHRHVNRELLGDLGSGREELCAFPGSLALR